jgi:hypothetical protein
MLSKNRLIYFLAVLFYVLVISINLSFAEPPSQALIDLANGKLAEIGKDPVIVAAVKAANAQGKSLDEIKARDKEWIASQKLQPYMRDLINSETGRHLSNIYYSTQYFMEIFVMDNQGANVAMTNRTSDYWQGDEAKFKKAFNDGKGGIFIDEVEFDLSCMAFLIQISVPVMDGGKAIGAITFGIDSDRI